MNIKSPNSTVAFRAKCKAPQLKTPQEKICCCSDALPDQSLPATWLSQGLNGLQPVCAERSSVLNLLVSVGLWVAQIRLRELHLTTSACSYSAN